MPASSGPLVETRGLTKTYGSTVAVDSIDLTIRRGEVFGLLGPNGAGKTTTVLMLLGLSEPDSGSVRVCGLDPARHALAVKRQVGYLPDTVGFYEQMTGRQNLAYTARLNELEPGSASGRIDELLELVGLPRDADRPVGGYSRGMRQRLGLADALLKDPLVVILDEPMVGIDPEGVVEMQALITRLAHEDGRAVLLTSHMLHQVQRTCDRMAIFVSGRVVAEGSSGELASKLGEGRSSLELRADTEESMLRSVLREEVGADAFDLRLVGAQRWRVSLEPERVATILPALVRAGVQVRELRDTGAELDEIYHRYFESGMQGRVS